MNIAKTIKEAVKSSTHILILIGILFFIAGGIVVEGGSLYWGIVIVLLGGLSLSSVALSMSINERLDEAKVITKIPQNLSRTIDIILLKYVKWNVSWRVIKCRWLGNQQYNYYVNPEPLCYRKKNDVVCNNPIDLRIGKICRSWNLFCPKCKEGTYTKHHTIKDIQAQIVRECISQNLKKSELYQNRG